MTPVCHVLRFYVVQSLGGLAIGKFRRCTACGYIPPTEAEERTACPGTVHVVGYTTAADRAEAWGAERIAALFDWGTHAAVANLEARLEQERDEVRHLRAELEEAQREARRLEARLEDQRHE